MIYAGFWRRFVALIIDSFVLLIPMVIVMFALGIPACSTDFVASFSPDKIQSLDPKEIQEIIMQQVTAVMPSIILMDLLNLLVWWLYYAIMESSSLQATLGKLAVGSIVTDLDGDRISFLKATGRHFGKLISALILLLGYLMAGFTERKQALHDLMAGCLVIQKESNIKPLYDLPE
ncbi:MAG TPA: RDD family protein [bacterium]|nr:RDD family protein [bacterium]